MAKDVIIIGAGVGGLATGVRLLSKGYNVKIIEKNSFVGGKTGVIKTSYGNMDLSASIAMIIDDYIELFEDIGKNYKDYIKLIPLKNIYTIFKKSMKPINLSMNMGELTYNLDKLSSNESLGYMEFLSSSYKKYIIANDTFLNRSFSSSRDFFNLGNMEKILDMNPFSNSYDYISQYLSNETLKNALAFQTMYIGVSPYESSNIYTLIPAVCQIKGIYHIGGGMYSFIKALEDLVIQLGGIIETGNEVEEIIINQGKAVGVKTKLGKEHGDIVVCNSDFPTAINELIKDNKVKGKYSEENIRDLKYSCSTFIAHLVVNKIYDNLNVHNIYLGKNFRENIEGPFKGKIPKEPSYYIYYPNAVDRFLDLPSCNYINVMMRVPNLLFKNTQWNDELIHNLRCQILSDLRHIDGMKNIDRDIIYEEYTTPLNFKEQFNTYGGCAFGLSQTLKQTNYFRPQTKINTIKNLYFVGASTHPGTGVSMVLKSSKICVKEILKENSI